MELFQANGPTLAYRLSGPESGRPIVLVNALGTDTRLWDGVVDRLAKSFRVLCYDQRGHGRSSPGSGPFSIYDLAGDLLALADHLAMPRFALCGVSLGGMVGQLVGALYPDRLSALILCGSASAIGDRRLWNDRIGAVEALGLRAISEAVVERWFSRQFHAAFGDINPHRAMLEQCSPEAYVWACAAIRDADLSYTSALISAPTRVVVGDQDIATPPSLVRETAAAIPEARFTLLAGCGHLPPLECPGRLAEILEAHVAETALG